MKFESYNAGESEVKEDAQAEKNKKSSILQKAKNLAKVAMAATLINSAAGCAPEKPHFNPNISKEGKNAIEFKLLSNGEKNAIYLQEYHDYFEKGIEPKVRQTDLEKKMGVVRKGDEWNSRTKARAIEIGLEKGFDLSAENLKVDFESVGQVPKNIKINGQEIPNSSDNYLPEEIRIMSLAGQAQADNMGKNNSILNQTIVSPEADNFL